MKHLLFVSCGTAAGALARGARAPSFPPESGEMWSGVRAIPGSAPLTHRLHISDASESHFLLLSSTAADATPEL